MCLMMLAMGTVSYAAESNMMQDKKAAKTECKKGDKKCCKKGGKCNKKAAKNGEAKSCCAKKAK